MADETLHSRLLTAVVHGPHDDLEASMARQEAALLAVVKLHAPARHGLGWLTCPGCEPGSHPIDAPDWPCWTIHAIAHELGITEEGDS